jgi:protein ImuB
MATRTIPMPCASMPAAPESVTPPRAAGGEARPAPLAQVQRPAARAPAQTRELWIGAHFAQLAGTAQLERLAARAQRFTPRVSLAPPDGLLLEVKGSLGLFGGASRLGAAFLADCKAVAARPSLALAPTAPAALAGARFVALAGPRAEPFKVVSDARLVGALAPLPLEVLRWPDELIGRLASVGVRTIGAALRLPRAGFARRFGAETLASLDRLVGRAADPRPVFQARERFRMRRGLDYEIERHDAVLAALAPLLEGLGRFLEAHQCGITELECRLWHRHAPVTRCVLKLVAPAADPQRLQTWLDERLAALRLPEPVRSCELRSGRLVPLELGAGALWQPGEHGGGTPALTESTALLEALRARLGPEAVHGLCVHPTHRPEAASRRVALDAAETRTRPPAFDPVPWPAFRRPAWLLPAPQLLSEVAGLPRRRGPLRLLGEPERIETGWWEGEEVARDYYCAVDARGVRLWIFRERARPHRWFLQGVWG